MNIKKHLLLCATPTKQKCFKGNEGQKAWECLKKTLKKFENAPSTKNVHILRSKADCLRVCKNGPILLFGLMVFGMRKFLQKKYLKFLPHILLTVSQLKNGFLKKLHF